MNKTFALKNDFWSAGIVPETGASVAYGRVKSGDKWVDVLRPTAKEDVDNASACSSFIMLPWCNRIGGGTLTFGGETFQLEVTPDDGTARHGDARRREFTVTESSGKSIEMTLDSRKQKKVNWPFAYKADVTYSLDGPRFVWELALTNLDTRPFPAGFGHHPYFVKPEAAAPVVSVPCDSQFNLFNSLATAAPVPVMPRLDFRQPRALPDEVIDDLLTGRTAGSPVSMVFPDRGVSLNFYADAVFAHWLLFTPADKPYFAVEPMSNASDGFHLDEKGIPGSGVFVLQPGETKRGVCYLTVS